VSRMGDFPLAAAMALVLLIIVAAVYAVSAKNLTLERKR
jgi:ABC-type spermidine/putrescine transport system permease subunit I